jgi:hypothetical protein
MLKVKVERLYVVLIYCVSKIDGLYIPIHRENPEYGTILYGYINI